MARETVSWQVPAPRGEDHKGNMCKSKYIKTRQKKAKTTVRGRLLLISVGWARWQLTATVAVP